MLDAHDYSEPIAIHHETPAAPAGETAAARPQAAPVAEAQPASAAPRDSLQMYLAWIRDIPLLERHEVDALSAEIDDCEERLREAMYRVPGTSLLVLDRWHDCRAHGRTTAKLAHGYRGDVSFDWAGHINEHLGALDTVVNRLGGTDRSRAFRPNAADLGRMAEHLRSAGILFEELVEIHTQLETVVADWEDFRNRRNASALGLGTKRARDAFAGATQALRDRSAACSQLASHNLRLVVKAAKRFRGLGLSYMDLIQEGNKGLMRAVEKYDHTKGFTFATYAVWWIDQAIIRGLQNHSRTVRVPSHVYQEQRKIRKAEDDLQRDLRRSATEYELASATGLDVDEVERVLASRQNIQSLDEPVGEKGRSTVGEQLTAAEGPEPGSDLDRHRIRTVLRRGLRTLPKRERVILEWRFGMNEEAPLTLRAVGEKLGISRERVRQLETKALRALSERADVDRLADYLDSPRTAA